MLDAAALRPVFADKLLATGSMDAALMKVIWVAYKAGLKDGAVALKPISTDASVTATVDLADGCDESRVDVIGQNGNDGDHYGMTPAKK